jgi:hypothetical protein
MTDQTHYDPQTASFWITLYGLKRQRFASGSIMCDLSEALRALQGGWKVFEIHETDSGAMIALMRK